MQIFICGFMGAGKSTFLQKLKAQADSSMVLVDSDEEINSRYNKEFTSLGEWIESFGFDLFREKESSLIDEYLKNHKNFIMALGGGGLSSFNLAKIKEAKAKLVWLKTPYEVCCVRIEGDAHRPLVGKGDQYLKELYEERELRYAQADLHLSTQNQKEIDYKQLLEGLGLDG